jgi:hypothetical protein
MRLVLALRLIGASHLLQPPLTALLARRLALREAFGSLPPVPAQIAVNMGIASIALPTCLGCLLAAFADEAANGGAMGAVSWLLAAFWIWRLARQQLLGRYLPRAWHYALTVIFVVQGPLLAAILAWSAGWLDRHPRGQGGWHAGHSSRAHWLTAEAVISPPGYWL